MTKWKWNNLFESNEYEQSNDFTFEESSQFRLIMHYETRVNFKLA